MQVAIHHLVLSRGHNFKGHHGGPPGTHPEEEQESLPCVAGRGVRGDRFFDYKEDFKGQITFFDWAVYVELVKAVGATDCPPTAMRRNVIVEGIDLNTLIGKRFTLQDVTFEGTEECTPCYWMDQAVGPGAEDFLQHRGGLRARILTDGELRAGPCDLAVGDNSVFK